MKNFPETKEDAKTLLREMMLNNEIWHFDDYPGDVFEDDANTTWRIALVQKINALWLPTVPENEMHLINVGAWKALEDCCPEMFDPNSSFFVFDAHRSFNSVQHAVNYILRFDKQEERLFEILKAHYDVAEFGFASELLSAFGNRE